MDRGYGARAVRIVALEEGPQLEIVEADLNAVPDGHFLLVDPVEGRAGEAHEHQHDRHVDHVAAEAARVSNVL